MDFGAAPNFTYFAHPRIHHIFPSAGASGVLVRVHGENLNLRASSAYGVGYFDGATATPRCSFGGVEVPASAVGAEGAELSSQLLCISPALDARDPVRLSVSLNGQEYTNETVCSSPSPSPSPRPSSSLMPNPSPNPNTEPNPDPNPTRTRTPTPDPDPDPDPGSTQVWWTPQREVRVLTLSPSHGPVLGGTRMEVLRGLQPELEPEPEP